MNVVRVRVGGMVDTLWLPCLFFIFFILPCFALFVLCFATIPDLKLEPGLVDLRWEDKGADSSLA